MSWRWLCWVQSLRRAWFIRTVLWQHLDGALLRTTEGPTETLKYNHKGCWGPPHGILGPRLWPFLCHDRETIRVLMDSLWNMAPLRYWRPCYALARSGKSGSERWLYISSHTQISILQEILLEIRQTLLGPSFLGQKPDKEGWDSNSPAWSWPSLITQNICQLLIKPQPSPEFIETIFFPVSTDCLHLSWLGLVFTCTSPLVLCPLPLPLPSLCLGL